MSRFEGKVALVTGAASGIGAATAALLREEGAQVVGVDVRGEGAELLHGDVTDPASVQAFVGDTIARHGGIDIVANVAGMVRFSHVEDTTLPDWQQHLAVNLTGPFLVSQAALPTLLERKGCIVNVASIAGLRGQPYTAAYCASKGGLVLLTKSMALELAARGVRVNAVCPSGVVTPLIAGVAKTIPTDADQKLMERLMAPNGLWVEPVEIAEAIAYLASPAARNITGTTLLIDGGTWC
ncbi:MAG: SDR family NAD(P)-dependent oxidoreductase [Jatrophihabitans sp.]|uniref:SDR family NAD(P)-dependent oxidoreductase n=1 Tax=Jatrophihabitans sp. TaxID=1932789 RepID=UPI00391399C8